MVFAFGIQFFDCLVELVDRMSVEAGQGSGALLSWKQCFAVRTVFRFGCWSFVLFYGDNFIVTLVVFSSAQPAGLHMPLLQKLLHAKKPCVPF